MVNRKRAWSLRETFDSVFYVLVNGCKWHGLPGEYPPWQTMCYYIAKRRERLNTFKVLPMR